MFPSAAKPFTAKTARSVLFPDAKESKSTAQKEIEDVQPEDLWGISCLNAETLALSRVTGDDRKVLTGDSEDCTAVFGVGVEGSCLGLERNVWHGLSRE